MIIFDRTYMIGYFVLNKEVASFSVHENKVQVQFGINLIIMAEYVLNFRQIIRFMRIHTRKWQYV